MIQDRRPDHPVHPLFTQRWSPRAFTGEPISESELFCLLEAGRWAPSAYNAQPWRFIYARRDTPAWLPILETLVEFNQGWAKNAAALVVIASVEQAQFPGSDAAEPNPWNSFDAGAAWASIAFQATLLNWSTHAMAGFEARELADAIRLPSGYAIQAVVAVGRRGEKAHLSAGLRDMEVPNDRRPLVELAMEGRFNTDS